MGFLRNIKLSLQVNLTGIIAIMSLLLIGGTAYFSSNTVIEAQKRQVSNIMALEMLEEVKYLFLNARRNEKDFIVRLDVKYIEKHAATISKIEKKLKDLFSYHPEPEVISALEGTEKTLKQYKAQFALVASEWLEMGLDEKSGLRGKLRASVHEVEEKLNLFKNKELIITMLMMRRHEKDFLLRIKEKYITRMDKRFSEFSVQLNESVIPQSEKVEILELMTSYLSDFKALAEKRLKLVDDTKQLSLIFKTTQPFFGVVAHATHNKAEMASDLANKSTTKAQVIILGLVLFVIATVLILGSMISKAITVPIHALTNAMTKLAQGEREMEIPVTKHKNELGEMGRSVLIFQKSMIRADNLSTEQAKEQEKQLERAKNLNGLTVDFEGRIKRILSGVETAVSEMETTANDMNASADQVNQQSTIVASAATEASSNVQTVAAASEELAASISEIGTQVTNSTRIAANAVDQANSTSETMQYLAKSADKVGAVVNMITDIAEQTNLLALNATIEAARAGEMGKGFAVVASEVKSLANQTATATEEIQTQVSGIQSATNNAVNAIDGISKTIGEINEIASAIAAAVEEQMAATQEIARNVEQASSGTAQVTQNISLVSSAAHNSETAADQVLGSSHKLSQESDNLVNYVNDFLTKVKSA